MPALSFDDLIPVAGSVVSKTPAAPTRGLSFDDLIPGNVGGRSPDASPMDYARDSAAVSTAFQSQPAIPSRPQPSMGQHMLEAERNNLLAARQRTDPAVYDGNRPLRKKIGVVIPEVTDIGRFEPGTFITPDNKMDRVDPSKHVVLIDPASGHPTVYERNFDAEGTDVTEEPLWKSLGRVILPGFVTNPVSIPSRVANTTSRTTEAAPSAMISQRAQNAADDLMSFERAQVPVFAPAFAGPATRSTAKGLAETWGIGKPIQDSLENTYAGMSAAATRLADDISPVATADQAGASLQRGLDRFRTAGVRDIEPGVLAERGIDPVAPIQPQQVMSRGAQTRATEAAPIRAENYGWQGGEQRYGEAVTQRGVPVPSARPLNQTIIARRSVDDMTDAEVTALTRAPAGETSFAVRSEALYERAQRQLPPQMRANETANPQLLQATNTRNAVNAMRAEQERTRIPGGVINGRFEGLAERIQTNVTLPTLRAMRTAIGRELANFNYAEMGLDRTQLNRLYASISRDIEIAYQDIANRAHIASRLGNNAPNYVRPDVARSADRALYEFRRADRYFRNGIQRMDSFLNVVNANNPEMAARRLVQAAMSGGKGDIALFRNAMSALRPEERADIASLVIRQMGTPVASARGIAQEVGFSPNSFATNYQKLDPRARAMLFPGQHGRALDDLFRVANRLSNVERFENVSGSGRMAVNVGGLMTGIGSALAGGWPAVFGTAAGGLGLSYMLSRPSYARWLVRYMELKGASAQRAIRTLDSAAGGTRRAGRGIDAALTAHINKLGQAAQRDPDLAQIYQSIATEDGVIEGGDENRGVDKKVGDENPDQSPQQQFPSPAHGGSGSTNQRFNPPMRLGGPKPADGATEPTAPTPGNIPRPEARPYTPTPSAAAGSAIREGANALGVPTLGERVAPVAETAIEWLTPVDDVSNAAQTGTAGSAATAGLNFIPGFKGGKKAAQKAAEALPALREEVTSLMGQLYALTKRARPLPGSFEKPEVQMKGLREAKEWAEKELAAVRAAQPTAKTSVPATTTPQAREVSQYIEDTPTIAYKGRQGFSPKDEQKRLASEFLQSGGQMTARPWGHTAATAREDVKRLLEEAAAKGKSVPKQATEAAERAAKKSDDAAREVDVLTRRLADNSLRNSSERTAMQRRLAEAERKAEVAQRNLNEVLKRVNKAGGG